MDDLGISKSFQSSSDEASKQLELIDALLTPIEKLRYSQFSCLFLLFFYLFSLKKTNSFFKFIHVLYRCVNGCINLISKAVSQLPASKDSFTSDDLIPWLSFVILQNKPKYLQANQYYMEYFLFCECPSSLSFSLTTLTAAVHFLLSDHFLDVLKKLGKYDEKLLKGQSQPGFLGSCFFLWLPLKSFFFLKNILFRNTQLVHSPIKTYSFVLDQKEAHLTITPLKEEIKEEGDTLKCSLSTKQQMVIGGTQLPLHPFFHLLQIVDPQKLLL